RLGAERDDRDGASGEVARARDDLRLPLRHALDLIAPLARRFERGFHCFGASVHWQDHFIAGELAQVAVEQAKLVVAEGAAGQRKALGLLDQRRADARLTVPLAGAALGA